MARRGVEPALPRMKEEEEATGRGGAELGRSAAQFTEPTSASPAPRAVAGLSCAVGTVVPGDVPSQQGAGASSGAV